MITPNGKEIEFYNEGFAIRARFIGGGELPQELAGSWTNKVFAKQAVDKYLEKLEAKVRKKSEKED